MGRRSKQAQRCDRCRMHLASCLCAKMPQFFLDTKLCLVMHCREVKKPTATGPMALSILANSERYVHGVPEHALDLTHLSHQGRRVIVLFPDEKSIPLDQLDRTADPRPLTLVVPDGNWRQASRVPRRVKGLEDSEWVTLPEGPATAWGIRRETREGGLATFEAIARAMGCLESPEVALAMEDYFALAVRTTLEMRGTPGKEATLGVAP